MNREKEYLGFYLSGHPFKWIEDYLKHVAIPYNELGAFEENNIKVAGSIQEVRKIMTKKNETAQLAENEVKGTENTDSQATTKQLSDEDFKSIKSQSFATEEEKNRPYQTHTSLQGKTITGIIPVGDDKKPMRYRRADGTVGNSFAFLWEVKDRSGEIRQRATHLTGGELDKVLSKAKNVPAPTNEAYSEAVGGLGVRVQFAQQTGEVLA